MKERRKHIRFKIDQAIEASYSRENYIYMEGLNLSESGMLCRTSENIDTGSRVYLMFSISPKNESYTIRCEGIVVRSIADKEGFLVGIRFTSLSEEEIKKIEEYSKEAIEYN